MELDLISNSPEPTKKAILEDTCSSILFSELCQKLEIVAKKKGPKEKLSALFNNNFFARVRVQNLYPLVRLLLPLQDDRKYYVKQKAIANTYINTLNLSERSADKRRLLGYADPKLAQGESVVVGDFSTILEDVLDKRVRTKYSDKTLGDVNEILDALALAGGKEGKTKVLRERIINEFNPQEQKWLMRIVFQDLKVGFGFESLLKKIGEEVWQKYDECSSLRTVFETIGVGIKITGLEVMTHFAPMLALGFNKSDSILGQLHSVEAKMKGQPFVMDIKLDGWRMLIHKKGSEVMMMSRRGENWTSDFYPVGKTVIQNIVHEECILDGELIGWDDTDNRHMRFGTCQKVGREEKEALESGAFLPRNAEKPWENQNHWLKFICFDITYIGGEDAKEIATAAGSKFELEEHDENHYEGDITWMPLGVRREILKKSATFIPNRFELVHHKQVITQDVDQRRNQLAAFFKYAIDGGEEGLVVKNLFSEYVLGQKSKLTGYWVKMKPDYGGQTDNLDLIILGGYLGDGRRKKKIDGLGSFLLGIKKTSEEGSGYHTLCKATTNYHSEAMEELKERILPKIRDWDVANPPSHLRHWKPPSGERPDRWIDPQDSCVVELKCAEITKSMAFSAGYTCRFPRLQHIRFDKAVNEIMTHEDIIGIYRKPKSHTFETNAQPYAGVPMKRKSGKKASGQVAKSQFRSAAGTVYEPFRLGKREVAQMGRLFEGMTFCVLDGDYTRVSQSDSTLTTQLTQGNAGTCHHTQGRSDQRKYERKEIIEKIKSQGGEVLANPANHCVIIAGEGKQTFQVNTYIKDKQFNVVKFGYVIDCIEDGRLLPMRPCYYLGRSKETEEADKGQFDVLGDSYTEECSPAELKMTFNSVDVSVSRVRSEVDAFHNAGKQSSKRMKREHKVSHSIHETGSTLFEQNQLAEKQAVLKDYETLGTQRWRQILGEVIDVAGDAESMRDAMGHFNKLWSRDVLIYVDFGGEFGDEFGSLYAVPEGNPSTAPGKVPQPERSKDVRVGGVILRSLAARLRSMGCQIAPNLHIGVTHILVYRKHGDEYLRRIDLIENRLRELRCTEGHMYEKQIVDVEWAERCLQTGRYDDPSDMDEIGATL